MRTRKVLRRLEDHGVVIGECPVCNAWIGVLRNGVLAEHVNEELREGYARLGSEE